MDLIPRDVLLIVYRYLHRSNLLRVRQQYRAQFEYYEFQNLLSYKTHTMIFNWRQLHSINCTGVIRSIRDSNNWLKFHANTAHRLPKRYRFSNGTRF